MPGVMMQIGGFQFSIGTAAYQELTRIHAWRWNEIPRAGRAPASQYDGPAAATMELSGVIYPHYKGGTGQIAAMRTEAGKGEPLMLVDGTGKVWGKWVILTIEEGQDRHFDKGLPLRQRFRISLREYGDDD